MKLEEGKRYVTRCGSVTSRLTKDKNVYAGKIAGFIYTWYADGQSTKSSMDNLEHEYKPIPSLPPEKKESANSIQHGGDHYKSKTIQPWDYVAANNLGFFEGNAIKYITRHKDKNGIEDLKKAIHYLQKLIELEQQNESRTHNV
jgi:hypothetical protein